MTEEQQVKVEESRDFFFKKTVTENPDGTVTVSGWSMPHGGWLRSFVYGEDGTLVWQTETGPYL